MMIYNLILYLISPYLISRVIIEAIRRKSGISFIGQRLGLFSKKLFKKPIWIHASSVGETKAAISLYKSLSKKFPEENFLITTNTSSSRDIIPINKNLEHTYLPLDWLFTTRRFINLINPRICILIETELWPNLISICKKNNISIQLGYLNKNIKVVGNLKYADTNNTVYNNENIVNRKYVLALSTHPDEERQIITEWMRINEKKVLLVIMPRHPERLGDILSDIPLDMLSISIRSKNEPIKKSTQIYIADTYGEANLFLEHCEFVYLGGSLVDHGGQNFMEAASYGKTIIVGPYMYNFIEETEEFLKNNAMIMVKSSPTLKHVFERLIKSKQRRELFGANAKKILLSKKDIINDYCKEIQSLL
jgi:3-deoxy-D-manno-octulosonic-acid transferase